MTVKRAKLVFAVLMQAAREGRHLTQYDKQQLSIARQTLRQIRKPVRDYKINPRKGNFIILDTVTGQIFGNTPTEWGRLRTAIIFDYFKTADDYVKKLRIRYGSNIKPVIISNYGTVGEKIYYQKHDYKKNPSQRIKAEHADVFIHNPPVMIYGKVNRIIATKTQKHICDTECKRHGHRYYHDFTSRAQMYGLPDGSILIKSK